MRGFSLAVTAFVLCVLAGCAEKPVPPATVNGEPISSEFLEMQLKERMRMHQANTEDVEAGAMRAAVLNQLIDERLMLQAAAKAGIVADEKAVDDEFARARGAHPDEASFQKALESRGLTAESFRKRIREKIVLSKFVDSLVGDKTVSDESLKDHFESLRNPPRTPERVKMRLIQTPSRITAEEVAEKIRKAGPGGFDKVADEITGKLGMIVSGVDWVQPGTFSPKTAEVVRGLNPGGWAGPTETKVSWYLIKVYEREEPRAKTFDEARDELRAVMLGKIREDAVTAWLAAERPKATIVKNLK